MGPDLSLRSTESTLIRSMPIERVELRDVSDDSAHFEGYASTTGIPYEVHDMFGTFLETVEPGAFKRTLASSPDVQFLVNHAGIALARTTSGTMTLREDKTGLHVSADLDMRITAARDLRIAIERGDMDQMSFAFRVVKGGDQWNDDYTERSIFEVSLDRGDVSAVNQGANPHTFASVRFLDGISVEDLAAAIRAVSADDADPDAVTLVRRAVSQLTSILPSEEPAASNEEYAMRLLARRYAA